MKKEGRVFVVGDTHGFEGGDMAKVWNFQENEGDNLTKDDVLIQLGDFACVWYPIGHELHYSDLRGLEWWANCPWTTAVVLGNHEGYDAIEELPWTTKWDNDIQYFEAENGNRIYFFKRGGAYNINGRKVLTISGAYSIDKDMRIEGKSWWAQEDITYEQTEFCLDEIERVGADFDYVLSHTCPQRIIPNFIVWDIGPVNCPTAKFLDIVDDRVDCKKFHFGHFHTDKTLVEGDDVNNQDVYMCHYNNPPYELK